MWPKRWWPFCQCWIDEVFLCTHSPLLYLLAVLLRLLRICLRPRWAVYSGKQDWQRIKVGARSRAIVLAGYLDPLSRVAVESARWASGERLTVETWECFRRCTRKLWDHQTVNTPLCRSVLKLNDSLLECNMVNLSVQLWYVFIALRWCCLLYFRKWLLSVFACTSELLL